MGASAVRFFIISVIGIKSYTLGLGEKLKFMTSIFNHCCWDMSRFSPQIIGILLQKCSYLRNDFRAIRRVKHARPLNVALRINYECPFIFYLNEI